MSTSSSLSAGPLRVDVECVLRFLGPLHVGSGERLSVLTDAPVLRDRQGRPYLPGSSLRGVLREHCEREHALLGLERAVLVRLFGPASHEIGEWDRQGRLKVMDTRLDLGDQDAEVRDHVRHDRKQGSAADGGKFDQEVSFATRGEVRLVYEGDGADDPELILLRAALRALERGRMAMGGKSAWGLGLCRAEGTTYRVVDRSSPAGLSGYLRTRLGDPDDACLESLPEAPWTLESSTGAVVHSLPPLSWLRLQIDWVFDGPMLVAGPCQGDRPDVAGESQLALEAVYQSDAAGNPLLPGSSLRGALQAHARRIAATLEQGEVAERLFGCIDSDGKKTGRRGLLRMGDGSLTEPCPPLLMRHVAIDRITQFAADGRLFDAAALQSPVFRNEIHLTWNPEDPLDGAAVALLLFALRDAGLGDLWVGSRTTRGYGSLQEIRLVQTEASLVERADDRLRRCEIEPFVSEGGVPDLAKHAGLGPAISETLEIWSGRLDHGRRT